ncbi:MAG: hypothetical protein EOP54_11450 [Sphingobacteriales bacterium]|nr:MAG: hypothetical protein EOP54_11450 [Sphingobacteriales bacterium]
MKYLIKAMFTLIAVTIFTAVAAQTTGAYLKFEIEGKTIALKGNDLASYNSFEAAEAGIPAHNNHALFVTDEHKQAYKLELKIFTAPHTNPVVGKLPFVPSVYAANNPLPAVSFYLTKNVGERSVHSSRANSKGYVEITKVANGWVEGKFAIDISHAYYDEQVIPITNGSFRFKIEKEM